MTLLQNIAQFLRFGIVGSIGFLVDMTSYTLLTRLLGWDTVYCLGVFGGSSFTTDLASVGTCVAPHVPIVATNMASVSLAVLSNFFLNKYWTFRDPSTTHLAAQGAGYVAMSAVAWALNQVLTGVFVARLVLLHVLFGTWADVAAKILAIIIIFFFNYSGSRFVIFRAARSARRLARS